MANDGPLISCILPTFNRRGFLPHAIQYFFRQDYANKELLVVDDGGDPVGDLIPQHPQVRYLRLPQKITLGAKLNLCCAETRGPIIAQWDDDDWYAPDRLSRQMEALQRTGTQVCGISDLLYYDITRGTGHRYVYPNEARPWVLGASLFFRRELWEANRFADVDIGMDALFVWAAPPQAVLALPQPRFAVHLIHGTNVSPKSPHGSWWSDHPVGEIQQLMGDDWKYYAPDGVSALNFPRPRVEIVEVAAPAAAPVPARVPKPTANLYACLVHEARDCVLDLCRNLRYVDRESTILLYNGGQDPGLLAPDPELDELGVVIHPSPRPMRWGALHDFAFDCMRYALEEHPFETMTVVDSDMLALRSGWPARVKEQLASEGGGIGLLGNSPDRLYPQTDNAAAITAWHEVELWRPFLRRFHDGESKFVQWSFWPGTVITGDAARELCKLYDTDTELREILQKSRLWVTEEILLPTLIALLGFRCGRSPGSYDYVRYRQSYNQNDLERALSLDDGFWMHPVARRYDDPLRRHVRDRLGDYRIAPAPVPVPEVPVPVPAPAPSDAVTAPPAASGDGADRAASLREIRPWVLAEMRRVQGWLADTEADMLITVADRALAACPDAAAIVEVGSFRGKATTVLANVVRAMRPDARVWAIDPHDGIVGALDRGVQREGPTLESFQQNIARAGLQGFVETVQSRASDVAWSLPICLLLVDGLHDYASVASDFRRFEPFLDPGALVAFHDYADYYPGVRTFVDELLHSAHYQAVEKVASLIVLRKSPPPVAAAAPQPQAAAV
jgi:glycosyltransferase involved in cell wall biosynthesis